MRTMLCLLLAGTILAIATQARAETILIKGCQSCEYSITYHGQFTQTNTVKTGRLDSNNAPVHLGEGNTLAHLELIKARFRGQRNQSPRTDPKNPVYEVRFVQPNNTIAISCSGASTPHKPK